MQVNLNGILLKEEDASINALIPGMFYGQGVFETILVRDKKPCFIDEHLERLFLSFAKLDIAYKTNKSILYEELIKTIKRNKIVEGIAKITISKGQSDFYTLITTKDKVPYTNNDYIKGYKLATVSYKNNPYSKLTFIKSCNYLENILAKKEALEKGADEGLVLNIYNKVSEGTVSNVFIIINNKIYTPPIEVGLLPGIVRNIIIRDSKKIGFEIKEKVINYDELVKANEVFITNSLMGIMPVVMIDGFIIGKGTPGEVTQKIFENYLKFVLK